MVAIEVVIYVMILAMIVIAFKVYPEILVKSNNAIIREKIDDSKSTFFELYNGPLINVTASKVDPDRIPNSGDEYCEIKIPIKAFPPKYTTRNNYFFINMINIGKYKWYITNISYNNIQIPGTYNKFSFNTKLSNIPTFEEQYFIWVDVTLRSEIVCDSQDTIIINTGISKQRKLIETSTLLKVIINV